MSGDADVVVFGATGAAGVMVASRLARGFRVTVAGRERGAVEARDSGLVLALRAFPPRLRLVDIRPG